MKHTDYNTTTNEGSQATHCRIIWNAKSTIGSSDVDRMFYVQFVNPETGELIGCLRNKGGALYTISGRCAATNFASMNLGLTVISYEDWKALTDEPANDATTRKVARQQRDEESAAKWAKASQRKSTVITREIADLLIYTNENGMSQTNVLAAAFDMKIGKMSSLLNKLERWGLVSSLTMNPGTSRAARLWTTEWAAHLCI